MRGLHGAKVVGDGEVIIGQVHLMVGRGAVDLQRDLIVGAQVFKQLGQVLH